MHRCTIRLMVICCLISYIVALNVSYEESLAKYYKAYGTIKWKWDPEPICTSQTPSDSFPLNFRRAYILTVDIMLERANCTKIRMEALHCEYNSTAEKRRSHIRRKTFYVNGLNYEIFHADKPYRSKCNDDATWIIYYGIFGAIRRPMTTSRFTSYTEVPDSILKTEKLLVEYYEENGDLKVIWNTQLICEVEVPDGYIFREGYIDKRDIVLEWTNCAKIRMEVLNCEYRMESMMGFVYELQWQFYTNGPNGEIYSVQPSQSSICDGGANWTIYYEILADEGATSQGTPLSDVAKIAKIFNSRGKENILRKRKWPQIQQEEKRAV